MPLQQTSSFFSLLVKISNYNTAALQVKLKDKLCQQSSYKRLMCPFPKRQIAIASNEFTGVL